MLKVVLNIITETPNPTHATAGNFFLLYHLPDVSFKKHAGGRMNANAVAENPPVSSKTIPKSLVNNDINIAPATNNVVIIT